MSNPAESYEQFMVPPLFAPWASRLIEAARPQPGERVLDVGCGTGIVARRVAPCVGPGGRVVGLDLNPHMLEVARATAKREGLAIEWHEGRAEQMPFGDGDFDLVLSQFALMFFADQRAALAEMHRVLAIGGRVAASVFQGLDRHPFYATLHEVIRRKIGVSALEDIFSLGDAAAMRSLLSEAGFQNVEIEQASMTARFPDPSGFLAGEIAVDTAAIPAMQHLDAGEREEITHAIAGEMAEPLRAVTEGDYVVLPFHVHIASGTRH
jgi:ubiquinone/menaquinone biosynthesis C-methylase UbiE